VRSAATAVGKGYEADPDRIRMVRVFDDGAEGRAGDGQDGQRRLEPTTAATRYSGDVRKSTRKLLPMFLRRRTFNPKRRLCPAEQLQVRQEALFAQVERVRYSGSPEHKRNPGDFGLSPPSAPRPGKTLCDEVEIQNRAEALELLRAGLQRGTFSAQERDGWPQNVWAVTEDGEALEAQLEGHGVYHGYPIAEADPFREKVLERWAAA